MGHSSLVGTDKAPSRPQGTDEQALGPSDSTDSGSDTVGTDTLPTADPGEPVDVTLGRDRAVAPIEGTGEDTGEGDANDIGTDRIIDAPETQPQIVNDAGPEEVQPHTGKRGRLAKPS